MELRAAVQLGQRFRQLGALRRPIVLKVATRTVLAVLIIALNYSYVIGQTLSTTDCDGLRKIIEGDFQRSGPPTFKPPPADAWVLLEEAAENGCLSENGAATLTENLLQQFKTAVCKELEEHSDEAPHSVSHMLTLCKTRIATFAHLEALKDYDTFIALLEKKKKAADYRAHSRWLPYVQCITSAGFSVDKISESLQIVRDELKKDQKQPRSAQAQFATQVGIMLMSRLRIYEAISFFEIGDSFIKKGTRNQLSLYWLALHAHKTGDSTASRRYLDRLKELPNLSDNMKGKVPFLEVLFKTRGKSGLPRSDATPSQASLVLRDLEAFDASRRPR